MYASGSVYTDTANTLMPSLAPCLARLRSFPHTDSDFKVADAVLMELRGQAELIGVATSDNKLHAILVPFLSFEVQQQLGQSNVTNAVVLRVAAENKHGVLVLEPEPVLLALVFPLEHCRGRDIRVQVCRVASQIAQICALRDLRLRILWGLCPVRLHGPLREYSTRRRIRRPGLLPPLDAST